MEKNIGTIDRVVRGGVGVVFLIIAYQTASWILFGIGAFCLYEFFASWCPFYQLIGRNTCPINPEEK